MTDGYTQQQLIEEARRSGYAIGGKLIERWVTVGLLDQATGRGRGRGRGTDWRWPQGQRDLLLTLLRHHARSPSVRPR
jgi:hypothetical protein